MIHHGIRVQKDVPLPPCKPRGRNGHSVPRYPWNMMQVGDSFLFPLHIGRGGHAAAANASTEYRKFVCRKVDDGYRCWRIK